MLKLDGQFATGIQPNDLVAGDFDGDGRLDLVIGHTNPNMIRLWVGVGNGDFVSPSDRAVAINNLAWSAADLDGDGDLDLVGAVAGTGPQSGVQVLLGDGHRNFSTPQRYAGQFGNQLGEVAIGDINGDGHLDLVGGNSSTRLYLWQGVGDGTFEPASTLTAGGAGPTSVVLRDLDDDGDLDLLTGNPSSNSVSVFLNDGHGVFGAPSTLTLPGSPWSMALGDLDGDGHLDLVTAGGANQTVSVLRGNGAGGFGAPTSYVVGDGAFDVNLADLNGDGHLDIVAAVTDTGTLLVLSGDGAGGFAAGVSYATGTAGFVRAAVADIDDDGRPDVAVINQGAGNVSIFLNTGLTIAADNPAARTEGASYTFTVTRFGSLVGTASASWTVTGAGGAPADAADFQGGVLPSGTVSFADGENTQTITVNLAGDAGFEPDEGFTVTLSSPVNIDIERAAATSVILNDDGAPPPPPPSMPTQGGSGDDVVTLGGGPDTYAGGPGNDWIWGGDSHDTLQGNAGSDTVHGFDGNDVMHGGKDDDEVLGEDGNDVIFGDLGDDLVHGGAGNDLCEGGEGNDTVRGGQGNDLVLGGAGDDWLSGDKGDDTVTGGTGADTFHSFSGAGLDRITDFSRAEGDRLMLDPGTTYTATQVGADAVISIGGGGQVILVGVQVSTLGGDWILGV